MSPPVSSRVSKDPGQSGKNPGFTDHHIFFTRFPSESFPPKSAIPILPEQIERFKFDGFVKSPTSVRHAHGPEQSRRAALRCIPCPVKLKAVISRDMEFRSCLKTVTLNSLQRTVSTPHSSGFARLEFGAFYFAIEFRPASAPQVPPCRRGEGAQLKMTFHFPEAPPCGRGASLFTRSSNLTHRETRAPRSAEAPVINPRSLIHVS
jgi:hypothetical protein